MTLLIYVMCITIVKLAYNTSYPMINLLYIAKSWSILVSYWEQSYQIAAELTRDATYINSSTSLIIKSVVFHLHICETDYFKNVHKYTK